ncbi:MAG: hypothetical protein U0075_11215 [Thermomicrobiales bacterium]
MVRQNVDARIRLLTDLVSRRALARLSLALPAAAGLATVFETDGEARRRRQRRRARHRHNPGSRKGKHKKRCKNKKKFCKSHCGPVKKKHCKKLVDCGPCRVFLTSTTQDGNLGGLNGADAICQGLAASANLPGTYRAWLSDDAQSPSTRFSQSSGPYQLLDGVTIASSWADLTDGTLAAPITVAENGATFEDPGLRAWTNTLATGGGGGVLNKNCAGWTTNANGSDGDEGQVTATNDNWTDFASGTCNNQFHLYCFQQS